MKKEAPFFFLTPWWALNKHILITQMLLTRAKDPAPLDVEDLEVNPGEIYTARNYRSIRVRVTEGVSVCLIERKTGSVGMNHFIYPYPTVGDLSTAKFGIPAMRKLITMMRDWSPEGEFEAYIFGGATVGSDPLTSLENCQIARELLADHGIPVVLEDTGGISPRRVVVDFATLTPTVSSTLNEKTT